MTFPSGVPEYDQPETGACRIGRRRFLQGVGATAGAGALGGLGPSSIAAATSVGASRFRTIPTATRIVDTRNSTGNTFTRVGPNQIRQQVTGTLGVPIGTSAIVATVTAVNGAAPNFVTVFPSGSSVPTVSNLNMTSPGATVANLVTVKLSSGGSIDIYSLAASEYIVDLIGYYEPVSGAVRGGRFVGLSTARRAIDTRSLGTGRATSGSVTVVDVTPYVPSSASSIVINLTATQTTGAGFFTAFAYSEPSRPAFLSSLNFTQRGATRAAAVIVPISTIGGKRRIKIFTLTAAHVIVDVNGFFTGESSEDSEVGLFVAMDPERILDTRMPGEIGKMWPRWVVEAKLPGAAAQGSAIVANLTGVETRGPGFLTIAPARQPVPSTSNVNFTGAGQLAPNHVISPITQQHGIQVYSSHGCHVIVDIAGYFTGAPKSPILGLPTNPPPPPIAPPWTIRVPRFGLVTTVTEGNPQQVTDQGRSWHWTGTGYMGQAANVAVFAHRTAAGGPYRHLNTTRNGDLFTVTTSDNREYTYRVVRRDLTNDKTPNILAGTRYHQGTTMSLIACTVGFDSSKSAYPDAWAPTSLKYRIIVTGELVSWREL